MFYLALTVTKSGKDHTRILTIQLGTHHDIDNGP